MEKLNSSLHPNLTSFALRKLAQIRVSSMKDFLQEDPEKLASITKLEIQCILSIRENIFMKFSAPITNAADLLSKQLTKKKCLETGIASLDFILNGGIPIGYITEVYGLSGSGKTQLCMQIAINCVKSIENLALYIDTKGDFSAIRIQKVLDAFRLSHKEMAEIMFKIKTVHIWSMEDLIQLLGDIKNKKVVLERLSVIIIDSLPSLMFQHFGDNNKIGLKYLNMFVNHARYLCTEFEMSIVCINYETRWFDLDTPDVDDDFNEYSTAKEAAYIMKKNRCLGKYWRPIPLSVLYLEILKSDEKDNFLTINITAKMYNNTGQAKCSVHIGATGVT